MKGPFAFLALGLASLVVATDPHPPPAPGHTVHHTTYVTVTECPITKTKWEHGTTKVYTELTTSTITVTSCIDCEGVTTVPGPTGVATTTTKVLVTYTTVCPVTETITEPGNTYTVTKTTTSTVVTSIPTTIYESVHGPVKTTSIYEGYTTTVTSLCPVTETKTLDGDIKTITYTTTSVYVTVIPTTYYATTQLPDSTTKVIEGVTVTSTSLCPITKTTTIGGKVHTVTYTSTSVYVTVVPTHVQETVHLPESTSVIHEGITITSTSLCPITETKTIGGEVTYITYTSTSIFETVIPTTIHTYVEGPDVTSKVYEDVTLTKTSLYPVTVTETKDGGVKTYTYTQTSVFETHVPTTVHETIKTYETEYTTVQAGSTIVIPTIIKSTVLVTEEQIITKTLEAPTHINTIVEATTIETIVPVTTEVVEVPNESVVTIQSTVYLTIPTTILATHTQAPATVTLPDVTVSSLAPITQIIDGQPQAPKPTTTLAVVSQISDGQPQAPAATQSAPTEFTGAANTNGVKTFAMAAAAGVFFAFA